MTANGWNKNPVELPGLNKIFILLVISYNEIICLPTATRW